jgi:hypothetical protein
VASFDELEPTWLAPGPGKELLARLQDASATHGRSAVASLLAADSEPLPEDQRALLLRLSSEPGVEDAHAATRSISDCIATLEIAALDREKRALEARRVSCTDRTQQLEIDEELQRIMSRRHDLQKRKRQL